MNAMHDLPARPRLVADIGGTNARFALLDGQGLPTRIRVLECADHPDLLSAVETYLKLAEAARPEAAVIAIANPVTGDRIAMTNHHWSFSVRAVQAQLGLSRLSVINDFEALALALPTLAAADLTQVGGGEPVADAPLAVLGPGTGLGVAGLVRCGPAWQALAGEGGHVTLAAADDAEAEILAALRRRFGHVSAERVLSGPGLAALYETLCELRRAPPQRLAPADITRRASVGADELCLEAVTLFCAMLGTVAGNLALTLGARGGVYLGGGILPRLGTLFGRSPFRSRFEEKGRFAPYLAAIPCYVIHAEQPALIGASRYFDCGAPA